jgi:isoleucyl-tRNA synthetase
VHEAIWNPINFSLSQEEQERWKLIFEKRELWLSILELQRKYKVIGKSLDSKAKVLDTDPLVTSHALKDFQEVVNVSQIEVTNAADTEAKLISHADGQKCERCWHWETDIGQNAEHPTICGRCVEAVKQFKA